MAHVLSLPLESRLWQHAAPMATRKPRRTAAEIPAVEIPKAQETPADRHARSAAIAAWVGAATGILSLTVTFIVLAKSPFTEIDDKLTGMKNDAALMRKDVDLALNWIRKHDGMFPGSKSIPEQDEPPPIESAAPETSAAPAPETAPSGPRGQRIGLPPTAKTIAPPVCMGRQSKRKFSCDQAKECWERTAFAPDFFKSFAERAGTENVLICDPR